MGGMDISVTRVHSDFYVIMAQVLPLLLLALIQDLAYLNRLAGSRGENEARTKLGAFLGQASCASLDAIRSRCCGRRHRNHDI
jgi:hypothetical protein